MSCQDDGSYTWRVVAGDDSTRVFEYRDSANAIIDLTGYTALCVVDVGTVDEEIVGTVNGVAGQVTVTIPHAVTEEFRGNGTFKLKLTSPGGLVKTLAYGPLVVKL